MIYVLNMEIGFNKALLISCYNEPSYQSIEPKFLQKKLFINNLPIKYTKINWK